MLKCSGGESTVSEEWGCSGGQLGKNAKPKKETIVSDFGGLAPFYQLQNIAGLTVQVFWE